MFAYGNEGHGMTSDEHWVRTKVRTARTTNGTVIKGELLLWLPYLFGNLGCENLKSKCMSCVRVPLWMQLMCCCRSYNDDLVLGHLPKAQYQGFVHCIYMYIEVTELHVLSSGIVLELISSWENLFDKFLWVH